MGDCSGGYRRIVVPAHISQGRKKGITLACQAFYFARAVTSVSHALHSPSSHGTMGSFKQVISYSSV